MQNLIEVIVSSHRIFVHHALISHHQNKRTMILHITLNIQSVLQFTFIALIAAPLPVLLLSSPLQYINEKIQHKRYYSIVKKHFENPGAVSAEQLQDVFPTKNSTELNQIAYYLQEENTYKDN